MILQKHWNTGNVRGGKQFTCYNFGGGVEDAIIVVTHGRLRGRRHAGPRSWPRGRPGGAGQRPRLVEGQRVGLLNVVRWGVRRGGSAWRRGLRLPLGMNGLRRLRRRVVRGVDQALFAGVPSGGDGWVMRGAVCLGATELGGKGAGLLRRGWSLLLGAFRGKQLTLFKEELWYF